jgi:hypothetical protein
MAAFGRKRTKQLLNRIAELILGLATLIQFCLGSGTEFRDCFGQR